MWDFTWPERFSTINFINNEAWLVVGLGWLLLLLVGVAWVGRAQVVKYLGWGLLLGSLAIQLINLAGYARELSIGSEYWRRSSRERQDWRYCDNLFVLLGLAKGSYCPLSPLFAQLDKQVARNSRLYIVPGPDVTTIYLRYRLAPYYRLVSSPAEAEAVVFFLGSGQANQISSWPQYVDDQAQVFSGFKQIGGDGTMTALLSKQ